MRQCSSEAYLRLGMGRLNLQPYILASLSCIVSELFHHESFHLWPLKKVISLHDWSIKLYKLYYISE